jgi:hypothetical protein
MKKNNPRTIFHNLLSACSDKDTYSVVEICQKMNSSYDQIKKLADDAKLSWVLEECRIMCASNAEIAGLLGRIPPKTAFQYRCENDKEFNEYYYKTRSLYRNKKLKKC